MCLPSVPFQSGLRPNQVDYVNAHATSTPLGKFPLFDVLSSVKSGFCLIHVSGTTCLGDAIEANAIKAIFVDHATSGSLAFSSTKVKFSISDHM